MEYEWKRRAAVRSELYQLAFNGSTEQESAAAHQAREKRFQEEDCARGIRLQGKAQGTAAVTPPYRPEESSGCARRHVMLFCSYTGTWRGNRLLRIIPPDLVSAGKLPRLSAYFLEKRGEKCFKDALRQPHCSHQLHKSCSLKLLLSSNGSLRAVHGADNTGLWLRLPRFQLQLSSTKATDLTQPWSWDLPAAPRLLHSPAPRGK